MKVIATYCTVNAILLPAINKSILRPMFGTAPNLIRSSGLALGRKIRVSCVRTLEHDAYI